MTTKDKAIKYFNADYNCAQSVLITYCENFGINKDIAASLSSGFGGGIARMQETCGAIIGGIMALGIAFNKPGEDIAENKEKVYAIVNHLVKNFKEKYNTIKCSELLNCNLNTEEGKKFYKENHLQEKICGNCIKEVINILDELIEKNKI
ncbi:MAG TPA: C-GCAxxG-C-C family protein [Bacteroidales bacterium]|nr:C-GCAxxG-C-C family protein [Bacteroidales bacterium]HPS18473.1 C-GCAxxG-C-C family protein [Bacteroidales bacterium]